MHLYWVKRMAALAYKQEQLQPAKRRSLLPLESPKEMDYAGFVVMSTNKSTLVARSWSLFHLVQLCGYDLLQPTVRWCWMYREWGGRAVEASKFDERYSIST